MELLQEQLQKLGIDTMELHQADISFLQDPTQGYDPRFGKSAIRCYRAFLRPCTPTTATTTSPTNNTEGDDDTGRLQLSAAAGRCARQVDFLIKRHKSHQAEWIRHHDATLQERTRFFPLILVLDNVRSAFNVGSLFRTADACGCQQVITTGITPHPHGNGADKLNKSALGAEHLVPSRHFGTTQEALDYLRSELPDFVVIGMETTAKSQLYTATTYSNKGVVLVLGNEVTGVDTEILSQLDGIVEIPTFGAKNSLNVAACAPVVLYEIIRQWQV
jgi:23S rRNA (guanosine2251-2'-O)-methyltransferase